MNLSQVVDLHDVIRWLDSTAMSPLDALSAVEAQSMTNHP